ncbi:hypothetical protein ACYJ1Y_17000 [Natrialbaceae archaeon A-gly3]
MKTSTSCERDVSWHRIVRGIFLFGCLALVVSGVFVAVGHHGVGSAETVVTASEDDENETVRHQDPAQYSEDGDSDGVQGWLERALGDSLESSAIELSQGEYDAAREVLGEDYGERFGQLVDVAGETGSYDTEDEDETTPDEDFEKAQEEQERLVDLLEEFDETYKEYEDAVESGEQERARELARDLEELADEINALSDSIEVRFERIGETTDVDLSEGSQAINETSQRVESQLTIVRSEQFEETNLTIETTEQTISFLEPLEVEGRLTTVDGTPIADTEITLEVEGDTQTVQTDGDGRFGLEYRPVDTPISMDELTVRYVPDRTSTYLGAVTGVPVSIEQESPTLTVSETTPETSYGEDIGVTGELAVAGIPVDDVPLSVAVGDESLGDVRVSGGSVNGTVEMTTIPPAGEHNVTIRLPFEDRALASTEETKTITVLETETVLSISETEFEEDELSIDGVFSTADGDAITEQPVQIVVDESPVTTATTTDDGYFNETVSLSSSDVDGDLEVVAAYDGSDTNLAPATASTVVSVEVPTATETPTTSSGPSIVLVGGLFTVGLILAGGGILVFRRRQSQTGSTDDGRGDEPRPSITDHSEATTRSAKPVIDRASVYLSEGRPTMAVQTGYAAVRRALRSEVGDDQTLTHWEFYHRYRGQRRDDLKRVTDAYEQVAYTPDSVSEREAESTLERVNELCDIDTETDSSLSDD